MEHVGEQYKYGILNTTLETGAEQTFVLRVYDNKDMSFVLSNDHLFLTKEDVRFLAKLLLERIGE